MNKKSVSVFSLLIMLSIIIAACSPVTGNNTGSTTAVTNPGTTQVPSVKTALSTQAQTAVASVVSSASTQTAAARSSTGLATPSPTGSSPLLGGATKSTPTTMGGKPTAAITAAPTITGTLEAPGKMVATLDWHDTWAEYFSNMPPDFYAVSMDEMENILASGNKPPFLLDVREPDEVATYGIITGAVNIPYKTVLQNLDKLPAMDQPIIVYSGMGHRGTIIQSALVLLGYINTRVLDGGITMWKQTQHPVELSIPNPPAVQSQPNVDPTKIKDLQALIETGTYGVTPAELNTALNATTKPIVIDVREQSEITAGGAIPGALHLPLESLFNDASQLPANKSSFIILVDQTGHRGTMAMMALRMLGYTNVRSLFGGMNEWIEANFPLDK